MFGKEKIPGIQAKIASLQGEVRAAMKRAATFYRHGEENAHRLPAFYRPQLEESLTELQNWSRAQDVSWLAGWEEAERWEGWEVRQTWESPFVRIGSLHEQRNGNMGIAPGFAPFIGQNRVIIIQTDDNTNEAGLQLLQSLVVRSALMLPHQARYTLVDPAGAGRAFPMRRYLPQVRENSGDVRRDLEGVITDIQRVIETYLDAQTTSFELVSTAMRMNEPYQFIFAADFPKSYDRRAIEALQAIGNTGAVAGTYLFIHHNRSYELPRDVSMSSFETAYTIDLTRSLTRGSLKLRPDSVPEADLQVRLFNLLQESKPPERTILWNEMAGNSTDPERWWMEEANERITAQIGIHGSNNPLSMWYGVQDGRPCAHGMLGAMTGAGKSNLYHVLIAGLVTRYSPEQLRLYLIDGKDGVEFQPYRRLPHAEVVSLRSSPELSRSVLAELIEEKERRNDLFTQSGTRDFTEYHRKGRPLGPLPRVLLLVDEYQELFEGDRDGIASSQLLQLAQQGRSAGIHMFLGSQHFGAVGMLNRQQIFDNFHMRAGMQMANDAIQVLTEFGRRGKALIESTCNLPGKIVLNDRSGDDSGNYAGKVGFLRSEELREILEKLEAKQEDFSGDLPARVIFDGKKQPTILDNPQFAHLLHQADWLSPDEMEGLARRPLWDDGFAAASWFASESPRIAWLGQDFSVRGQAAFILRRRVAENVVVIGNADAERYGMLAGIIASLALNAPPSHIRFVFLDFSVPGTPWGSTLSQIEKDLAQPAGFAVDFIRAVDAVEEAVFNLIAELDRRAALPSADQARLPEIYVIATELDRVDSLRRQVGSYGMASESAIGEQFARLYVEGPPAGIHFIMSFSGVRPLGSVVDLRAGLDYVRHRVATQMSEDASHSLVRSRRASQLQIDGPTPVCALYFDVENDSSVRFKPYTVKRQMDENDFQKQIEQIGQKLAERSAAA